MRATKVDAHREVMNAIPSGTSILPSIPERKKSGTKLTIIIRVELRIGIRTSFEASKTTFIVDFLCSEEFSRAVDGNLDAAALMKLVSDLAAKPERNEKADDESKNSSSAEVANKLSPIENVVPSEIENSLTSYFG